mgnify:CR=1 FL=1
MRESEEDDAIWQDGYDEAIRFCHRELVGLYEHARIDGTPEAVSVLSVLINGFQVQHAVALAPRECAHEWIDIRNSTVLSGSMCSKCRTLRAENFDR